MGLKNLKIDMSICRACMTIGPKILLFDEKQLIQSFLFVTQLEADKDDGLPSSICEKCFGRLKLCEDFKKQCETSDVQLRTFISNVNCQFTKSVVKSAEKTENDNEDDESGLQQESHDIFTENEDSQEQVNLKFASTDSNEFSGAYKIETGSDGDIQIKKSLSRDVNDEEEEEQEEEEEGEGEIEDEEHTHYGDMEEYMELQEYEVIEHIKDEREDDYDQDIDVSYVVSLDDDDLLSDAVEDEAIEEKTSKKSRNQRIKIHTPHGNYCTKCNKEFSSKTNLIRHIQGHDGMKPHICNLCGKGFTQSGSLKQHKYIHTGERPYVCEFCNRGFTQSKSLTCHLRRHTGEKPFTCDKCGLSFRQKDGLKRHYTANHSNEIDKFVCDCGKRMISKQQLKAHKEKEHPSDHSCPECPKIFPTAYALERHVRSHKKVFTCKICHKNYSSKSSLIFHMKSHDLPKMESPEESLVETEDQSAILELSFYQCHICLESFTAKDNFMDHLKQHNSTDSFICDECSLCFESKLDLDLHRNTDHVDDISEIIACNLCGIDCNSTQDLEQHFLLEHDEMEGRCDYCGEEFTSRKLLESHIQEHEILAENL